MRNFFTLIFVIFTIFSCQVNNSDKSSNSLNEFPILIDTFNFETKKVKVNRQIISNSEIIYIGKKKDSIYINYFFKDFPDLPIPPPPPIPGKTKSESDNFEFKTIDSTSLSKKLRSNKMFNYYINWESINNSRVHPKGKISIKVDTTQIIKNDNIHLNSNKQFYEAYPVLIENQELDTITLSYGHQIPLITEAKDSLGNWMPIERKWTYICGVGIGQIILPPSEIGISSTMIFHGNYKTKLRIKIDSITSNEFFGSINYNQFYSRKE